jgi:hypothetical protein
VRKNFPDTLNQNIENVVILCGINNIDNPGQVISDLLEIVRLAEAQKKNFVVCTLWPCKTSHKLSPATLQKNIDFVNRYILEKRPKNSLDLSKEFTGYLCRDKLHLIKK